MHHGANGLLNTSSSLKVSNSGGYYTAFPHSPIISARKRIFRNILARGPFEPSNMNSAFLYLKITVSLNSDEGGGFSPVALHRGYIQRLNLERAKKKAMTSSAWVLTLNSSSLMALNWLSGSVFTLWITTMREHDINTYFFSLEKCHGNPRAAAGGGLANNCLK